MIKLRQTFILLCLLFCATILYAQAQAVTGTVTDNNGTPLAGVTVGVKGKKALVTATGANGKFSIAAANPSTDVLIFSFVGFQKREVRLNGQSNVAITLQPGTGNLGEVVVVGYGTQKRADLTGAVSTIKADVLDDRPITDASQALSGTASGVWINQSSAQPGSDGGNILIRGQGTLGDSYPLIIVDGLISAMGDVNPSDIASITVLKDAASAAIYGSRAANGVILIQTKKGKKGAPQFDFTTTFGSQTATDLPKQVTNSVQYMNLYNQALANQGQPAFFSPSTISQYQTGENQPGANAKLIYPNNDWFKMIFGPAYINDNNLKISGGSDATQYLVSLGYLDQDGIVKNDNSKRYSALVKVDSRINKAIDFGINLNLLHWDQNQSWYNGGSNAMLTEVMRALPMYGTYTPNGQYAGTWVNVINAQVNNPYAMVDEGLNRGLYNTMQGSGFFNVEPIKGLIWNVTGGINYVDGQGQLFDPLVYVFNPLTEAQQSQVGNGSVTRSLTDSYNNNMRTTLYSTLTYTKTIAKDHNITALLGYNQEQYTQRSFQAYTEGFQTNSLTELNAGSINPQVQGTSSAYAIRSYFGRLNYAFKDKYLLEANIRDDGSSRFAPDKRWGFFPSFSAGWRIIEESFMKDQNIFSNLKLRASWGRLGNDQIGLYGYIPTLNLGRLYDFNSQIIGGVAQTTLSNPNITWETSTKKDVGLEMGFFQNKLSVEADYFNEQRSNILQTLNIPWTVGNLAPPTVNLAGVNNEGWELNTNYKQNIGEFKFNVGFNVTHVRNKVTDVLTPQIGPNVIEDGEPINAFYMVKSIGIFQNQQDVNNSAKPATNSTAPGDIKYQDISGPNGKPDGVIDDNDRQIVGKPIPTWTYGANLSVSYHNIDLSVLVQGVADVQSYVGGNLYFPFVNGAGITTNWVGNTWTPANTNAPLPRLLQFNAPTNNYMTSSFWLQNASYTRIKNIQLGYTFPQRISEKIKLKYIRLFVNAQNPFTFTKFQGLDPESAIGGSQYPNMKVFTGGVAIRF